MQAFITDEVIEDRPDFDFQMQPDKKYIENLKTELTELEGVMTQIMKYMGEKIQELLKSRGGMGMGMGMPMGGMDMGGMDPMAMGMDPMGMGMGGMDMEQLQEQMAQIEQLRRENPEEFQKLMMMMQGGMMG